MNIIREPKIYLVGRQTVDDAVIESFLADYGMQWQTDTEVGGERLAEAGGRLCYLSYGNVLDSDLRQTFSKWLRVISVPSGRETIS